MSCCDILYKILKKLSEYTPQLIPVFGTLAGTILGWLLKYLQDTLGKMIIKVEDFDSVKSKNNQYACNIKLFICNRSGQEKYIRNIKLLYKNGKKTIISKTPKINNDIHDFTFVSQKKDVEDIINLKYNEPKEYILSDIMIDKQWDELNRVNRIVIIYENEKGKSKEIVAKCKFKLQNVIVYTDGDTIP